MGTFRYVYNKTLEMAQKEETTPSWYEVKGSILSSLPEWADKVPYQIKSIAIKEALTNLKTQKRLAYFKHRPFKMHFKSRKAPQQSCYIPKSAVKAKGIYPRILGSLRYAEAPPEEIMDSRLVLAYDKFYLATPTIRRRSLAENQGRIVALDPGVRNFVTFVSHATAGHLASDDVGRIYRMCHYLDSLISQRAKLTGSRKRNVGRAISRARERIHNLVDELHCKTAKFLVDHYDLILIPKFDTKNMSCRASRKIRSKTVRALMTWSHAKFRRRLQNKAFEHGKTVVEVNEAYTSKTNNFTGEIDEKLGGKKFVKVDGKRVDRDINGALGILLRALGDTPRLEQSPRLHSLSSAVSVC